METVRTVDCKSLFHMRHDIVKNSADGRVIHHSIAMETCAETNRGVLRHLCLDLEAFVSGDYVPFLN